MSANITKKSEFIPGGQILTNLEEYSLKVQSEADSYAEQVRQEIEKIKKETEEGLKASLQRRATADDEAAAIIDRAKQEAETIIKNAQQEGFKQGYTDAENQFKTDTDQKTQQLEQILTELKDQRVRIFKQLELEMVDLSLSIAKKLISNELTTNPDAVLNILRNTIGKQVGLGKVKIYLNAIDCDYVKAKSALITSFLDSDQSLTIAADNSLDCGSIRLETDYNSSQLEIKNNLEKVEQEFAKIAEKRAELLKKASLDESK